MDLLSFLKMGATGIRRDMRGAQPHAEDISSLLNHLIKSIYADYGYMAAA